MCKRFLNNGWMYSLLSLFIGGMGVFAFSPYDFWGLIYVSVIGLLLIATQPSKKRALLGSFAWGLGFFGFGIHWIHVSLHLFGGIPLFISYFAIVLLGAYLALYPLLFAYVVQRFQIKSAVVLAILWLFLDIIRGWLFTGFPWLQLGYTQIDSPIAGIAPLFGVQGITFFIVWSSALVTNAVQYYRYRMLNWRVVVLSTIVIITVIITGAVLLGQADYRIPQNKTAIPTQKITLVQGNIEQQIKWDSAYVQYTIDQYERLIKPHLGISDIIILPEAAIPILENYAQPLFQAWDKLARQSRTEIIVGTIYQDPETNKLYNSVLVLGSPEKAYEITTENRYNKHHLVPFGEYLPLSSIFGSLIDIFQLPMSNFSSGNYYQPSLNTANLAISSAICYEIILGEQIQRNYRNNRSDYLLTISNDAWFGDSIGPWQHLQMARMRALELGVPLLRATNTGITAFIDRKGNVIAQAPQFTATTLTEQLSPERTITPYAIFGAHLLYGIVIILLLLNTIGALFRRKLVKIAQMNSAIS